MMQIWSLLSHPDWRTLQVQLLDIPTAHGRCHRRNTSVIIPERQPDKWFEKNDEPYFCFLCLILQGIMNAFEGVALARIRKSGVRLFPGTLKKHPQDGDSGAFCFPPQSGR